MGGAAADQTTRCVLLRPWGTCRSGPRHAGARPTCVILPPTHKIYLSTGIRRTCSKLAPHVDVLEPRIRIIDICHTSRCSDLKTHDHKQRAAPLPPLCNDLEHLSMEWNYHRRRGRERESQETQGLPWQTRITDVCTQSSLGNMASVTISNHMHTPCICCLLVKYNPVCRYLFYTMSNHRRAELLGHRKSMKKLESPKP